MVAERAAIHDIRLAADSVEQAIQTLDVAGVSSHGVGSPPKIVEHGLINAW